MVYYFTDYFFDYGWSPIANDLGDPRALFLISLPLLSFCASDWILTGKLNLLPWQRNK